MAITITRGTTCATNGPKQSGRRSIRVAKARNTAAERVATGHGAGRGGGRCESRGGRQSAQ
eukprot:4188059-Prymnesium_polylepis.1